ncbi:MAG: OPT/YSL family transporter [Deltaproteobacteria bacterium]|nr:OPT/YSL family transporter [Deltaproteobacteria bacterium]
MNAPKTTPLVEGSQENVPVPAPVPGVTVRSVACGFVFAVVLCAMNSYLTLSFGVIEEGPTIAALFFFALFFISRMKITTTEMVIVATMGSAGGSFGFIANFYAAKAMTGTPFTVGQMMLFGIVSSIVGIVLVVPLRELLIVKTELPWPGSKATASVIQTLVEHGDAKQPWYLLATFSLATFYVIFNKEDGVGWFPAEVSLGWLAAYGGALSFSPFAIGGSYLMGMRTCVGFLVGAAALMVIAPYLPTPAAPQRFVWPGIGFLTASGLTLIGVNWKVIVASMRSLVELRSATTEEGDKVIPGRTFAILAIVAVVAAAVVLRLVFQVPLLVVVVLIAVGGLLQNIIATRAQAQTAFNPARIMGILLEGVCWLFGGKSSAINLTGAGFVAGSGGQAGNLTGDMAYGRVFRVPPRWQFVIQFATIVPCAIVAAFAYQWVAAKKTVSLESANLAAPVAKAWAATSQIFDGSKPMPAGATDALVVGAIIGIAYTLLEQQERLRRFMPCSVGLGIGLVLPPSYGLAFFVGGFLFWIVLGRWARVRDVTLTTIAVGCVVAEGIGGVAKALLAEAGLF